jgi:hypothetical protein
MIQPYDPTDTSITRAEREYAKALDKENEDPGKRHRILIRTWVGQYDPNDPKTFIGYQKSWFWEPHHEALQKAIQEGAPILARSQISPYCRCQQQYLYALIGLEQLRAAVSSWYFPQALWKDLKGQVPRTVLQRLKDLKGQTFFAPQDAADAIRDSLTGVLEDTQIVEHGDVILQYLKQGGDAEQAREKRIKELQAIIDGFYGNAPQKPFPPTEKPCDFCHLPYRYSFWELFPYEQEAVCSAINALVGAPVMFEDIPKILEALEMWFFAADTGLFSKKKGTITMTGMLMNDFKTGMHAARMKWMEEHGLNAAPAPDATDISLTPLDTPPPNIPDGSPPDK